MTDDVDLLRKALSKYEDAVRMKNMSQELLQHLTDSIFYLIKYSEKYNIPLPKKEELMRMGQKADSLMDQITRQPIFDSQKNNRRFDRTCLKELLPFRLFFLGVNFGW